MLYWTTFLTATTKPGVLSETMNYKSSNDVFQKVLVPLLNLFFKKIYSYIIRYYPKEKESSLSSFPKKHPEKIPPIISGKKRETRLDSVVSFYYMVAS